MKYSILSGGLFIIITGYKLNASMIHIVPIMHLTGSDHHRVKSEELPTPLWRSQSRQCRSQQPIPQVPPRRIQPPNTPVWPRVHHHHQHQKIKIQ